MNPLLSSLFPLSLPPLHETVGAIKYLTIYFCLFVLFSNHESLLLDGFQIIWLLTNSALTTIEQ